MPVRIRLMIDEAGLSPATVERLLDELAAVREGMLVTLEGGGSAFCQGLDLDALAAPRTEATEVLRRFGALLDAISAAPAPVIAVVRGAALGGGLALAAAADLVVATPIATFGLPEVLFGLVPAMALPVVARRVGPARARWLAMSGQSMSAAEAHGIGLVDEVTDDPDASIARVAVRLDRLSARAVSEVKALSVAAEAAPSPYRDRAADAFARLLANDDTRARISRWIDGGTPWPDGDAH